MPPPQGPFGNVIRSAAQPDGATPSARLIQSDMQYLADWGGGVVVLPAGTSPVVLEAQLVMLPQVSLHIPAGCVVRAAVGYTGDLIGASNVSGSRIFGDGALIGNYDYTLTNHGIYLQTCQQIVIHRLRVAGFGGSGIRIDNDGYNRIAEVTSQDNGTNGIYLNGTTQDNQITDCWVFGNSQQGAGLGHGITILGGARYNTFTNCHIFDGADGTPTTFPATQDRPIVEVTGSSGTPDYTFIYALQSHGHVTSNEPLLLGVHSGVV